MREKRCKGKGEETKDEGGGRMGRRGEEQEEGDRCDPPQLGCLFGQKRQW